MRQYIDLVSDLQGNALYNASILVTNYMGGAPAAIFSDNGLTPITGSTVTTDITGQYSFFVADGDYSLAISVNGSLYKTLSPVSMFDGAAQVTQADTGSAANSYATSASALEKVLRTGLRSWINIAHTNTGASTYAYNGLTAKPIVAFDGSALTAGVLVTGGIYAMEYNGTAWQLTAAFLTAGSIGNQLYPPNAAEIANGVTITDLSKNYLDLRRYGIVPNNAAVAGANTTIAKQIWSPSNGIRGLYLVPIVTGADTWYFNGNIAMGDGTYLDGQGQSFSFAFATVLADNNCGCLTAQRNCAILNLNLTWVTTNSAGTSNYGNGLMFGGRSNQVGLFPAVYDSLLPVPMGNITVRNVRLNGTADPTQSRGILALGGLTGMVYDNLWIEGNAALLQGHYYEFGDATNTMDASAQQTSHMHNARFSNINIDNCVNSGLDGNGAYGCIFDGIYITNCANCLQWGVGESRFYRPWNPVDLAGAKHALHFRNLQLAPTNGNGITITGSSSTITGGYLGHAWAPSTPYIQGATRTNGGNLYVVVIPGTSAGSGGPTGTGAAIVDGGVTWNYVPKSASTDLLDALIENFAILGTAAGVGVNLAATTQATVREGTIVGCQIGVFGNSDSTRYMIDSVTIFNSTTVGIRFDTSATGVYSTARKSTCSVKNCFIAGSGQVTAQSAAISIANTAQWVIENNRFGYEVIHDDLAETTQGSAVALSGNCAGVTCRGNYVAATSGGTIAYVLASGGGFSLGCTLQNNRGVVTTQGNWLTDMISTAAQALASTNTIAIAGLSKIRVTAAAAVTGVILAAGTSATGEPPQEITVINESTAANSVTFAAAGTSNVADGTSDVIAGLTCRKFVWDPATSLWYRAA